MIELLGKDGCCLCDEAHAVLERVRADYAFELIERDITRDESLHRAYFERIPVVVVDGREVFDFQVDENELRAYLDLSGPGPTV